MYCMFSMDFNKNASAEICVIGVLFLAKKCPPPPAADNAYMSTDKRELGTVLTYTCKPGYSFAIGRTMGAITCLPAAVWSASVGHCTSRSLVLDHYYTHINTHTHV